MGTRQYVATLAHFLQIDPAKGGTENAYSDANDPVNETDLGGSSKRRNETVGETLTWPEAMAVRNRENGLPYDKKTYNRAKKRECRTRRPTSTAMDKGGETEREPSALSGVPLVGSPVAQSSERSCRSCQIGLSQPLEVTTDTVEVADGTDSRAADIVTDIPPTTTAATATKGQLMQDESSKRNWLCSHFTLSNPDEHRGDDLVALLRRLADELVNQGISSSDVRDVVFSEEVNVGESSWNATVYFDTPA